MQSTLRNAGVEETQAGINIARRNINNVRYADDTTLVAESEEELKSLFFLNFILFLNFTILYLFCHISTWICHRYTRVPHPEPSSLPVPSLWVVPVHEPQASCIVHRTWTGDSFHMWNESPVQVRRRIVDALRWCTETTQRDGTGKEEGGGFRMGNTCIPVVDSWWYMAKPIQYCKVKK